MTTGVNFRLFIEDRANVALAGLMSRRSGRSASGNYAADTVFLAAYLKHPSGRFLQVDLNPDSVMAAPMSVGGLAPEEFLCRYVLDAPCEDFIGFTVDDRIPAGADRRPWHTNIDLGGETVGIRWTSANLNHPWFGGSRWIPDSDQGNGRLLRARIVAELRRAAAVA
ncbi:MAG: hypothetical protein QOD74_1775 [Variibacter sp.]|nr:hypothetical protein [Variibacter sp.]